MATDRGLASVPRGLDRGLTTYLQSLDAMVRRLAGVVRGSGDSRAVRASETPAFGGGGGGSSGVDIGAIASQVLRDGSVTERKIADNAVTGRKLASNAVTADKLGENAITARAIAPGEVITNALAEGAVTTGKLAAGAVKGNTIAEGAVTSSKLAAGVIPEIPVLPVFVTGSAEDGDTVTIPGTWTVAPLVLLTWFEAVAEETFSEETDENGERVTVSLHTNRAGTVNIHEKDDEPGVWLFDAAGRFSWVAVCRS